MTLVRWMVTVLVLLGVGMSGTRSTFRIVGNMLRIEASRQFAQGHLVRSLDLYDRAWQWDPLAATASGDAAETVAYALGSSERRYRESPEKTVAVAGRGLDLFMRSITGALPGSGAWAGVSRLYEALRDYRPLIQEMDLSGLGTDPAQNLMPEDRLSEAALHHALEYEPRNYFYLDSLGELDWERGLEEKALDSFRKAVAIYPILEGHFYVTDRVHESDAVAGAIEKGLEDALERAPAGNRWVIARELGHLAKVRHRPAEAASHYRDALAQAAGATLPQRAALSFYLASMQETMGEDEAALANLRRTVELQPQRAPYHAALGVQLGRMDRHREALQALGAARSLAPGDPGILAMIARESRRAGDLDAAEKGYRDLIRLQPDKVEPYLQIIDLFRSKRDFARAIPFARDLVRLHPAEAIYRRQLELLYQDEVGLVGGR